MDAINTIIRVPEQHACFAGHFPGQPIVPGALLIQWILREIHQQHPRGQVRAVNSIKFSASLKPGDQCMLETRYDEHSQKLRLSCLSGSTLICKGGVVLVSNSASNEDDS